MADTEESRVALLLVDVINAFDFPGAEPLVRAAHHAAPKILTLRERAHAAGVPVIYVNDNFGRWRSDFRRTVAACSDPSFPGHAVARLLAPLEADYFVLKPRHSGFYCTALELLLEQLGVKRLVITGFAANICVLLTAGDAHMRGYEVWVPMDCTASNSEELTAQALEQVRLIAGARTEEAAKVDWASLRA
ncbi:MAG: cysteine hydrolase [Myxococcales bacterium]|nr:MAG: cysteine hydrolase [Myxococcales bacterium]